MHIKTFEIRDRGTFIPAIAIRPTPTDERDRWLLDRAGYGSTPQAQSDYVILIKISGDAIQAEHDAYNWGAARTMSIAHEYIRDHWDALENGQVICVETILGERETPKVSEQMVSL